MCCAIAVPSGSVVEVFIGRSVHCKPHFLWNCLVVREKRGKGDVQRERHTAEKIGHNFKIIISTGTQINACIKIIDICILYVYTWRSSLVIVKVGLYTVQCMCTYMIYQINRACTNLLSEDNTR